MVRLLDNEKQKMIRTLTGTIQDSGVGWAIINVNNIGYFVNCLTTNRFVFSEKLTFFTHLAVRETSLDLYGFTDKNELEMFELLLEIPKIGPKSALQILNLASPTLIVEATHKKDSVYLHKLSGVGKKTCENIVQYLSGKIEKLPTSFSETTENANQVQTDAIDTLVSLGYDITTARNTILNIKDEGSTVNSLVMQALKQIQ